jgi:hypothetical protein
MDRDQMVRQTAAALLTGIGKTFAVASKVFEQASAQVNPPPRVDEALARAKPAGGDPTTRVTRSSEPLTTTARAGKEAVADPEETLPPVADRDPEATAPPTVPAPEGPDRARTYETHVEELADKTASEIAAEVPELSTDELRRLYEHEEANKKRKTVLQAVERALAPEPSG